MEIIEKKDPSPKGRKWKTESKGPVTTIRVPIKTAKTWEQWVLLRSDVHHDSIKCNINLEKRHLDQAIERNAMIMDFGDTFDVMQGRKDPRRDPDEINSLFNHKEYYDLVLDHVVRSYMPYKDNFVLVATGNHENAVLKHAGTDLTGHLASALGCAAGKWGGWVRFMFKYENHNSSINLRYMHSGPSKNAPVTKGVIDTNRIATWLTDADIVYTGHDHNQWIVPVEREGLNRRGKPVRKQTLFVKGPGYKDGWGEGKEGFEVECSGGPKPMGSIWLRFYYDRKEQAVKVTAMLTDN
ncbi:hypothetical protein KA005_70360 [bacterium]|nr:hypothetical protein [bacterium]